MMFLATDRVFSAAGATRFLLLAVGMVFFFPAVASGQASDVEQKRMELMRERAGAITFFSAAQNFPRVLQPDPLFRYDDVPRGYVDGTVWRLGASGRPLAIVTTELHPKYLGTSPRIVYDFLSLSAKPFTAKSADVTGWTPSESAVTMKSLAGVADPAGTPAQRLLQMKRIIQRFSASQIVSEEDPEASKLNLRLLPRPIDRYTPTATKNSTGASDTASSDTGSSDTASSDPTRADGATFLFVAGRMPGVIVFLETDGTKWLYGLGRLSAPSTLVVSIDGDVVWTVPPEFGTWSSAYTASNATATIPGY